MEDRYPQLEPVPEPKITKEGNAKRTFPGSPIDLMSSPVGTPESRMKRTFSPSLDAERRGVDAARQIVEPAETVGPEQYAGEDELPPHPGEGTYDSPPPPRQ